MIHFLKASNREQGQTNGNLFVPFGRDLPKIVRATHVKDWRIAKFSLVNEKGSESF